MKIAVIEYKTNRVTHLVGEKLDLRRAEQVDDGMQHNMNHDKFYTLIVPDSVKVWDERDSFQQEMTAMLTAAEEL